MSATDDAPLVLLAPAERVLIHAPVALFACPIPLLVGFALSMDGAARAVALLLAWWSLSGAVMMVVDARSRVGRYLRLAALADRKGRSAVPRGMRDTVCGIFMSWALRYRRNAGHHS